MQNVAKDSFRHREELASLGTSAEKKCLPEAPNWPPSKK